MSELRSYPVSTHRCSNHKDSPATEDDLSHLQRERDAIDRQEAELLVELKARRDYCHHIIDKWYNNMRMTLREVCRANQQHIDRCIATLRAQPDHSCTDRKQPHCLSNNNNIQLGNMNMADIEPEHSLSAVMNGCEALTLPIDDIHDSMESHLDKTECQEGNEIRIQNIIDDTRVTPVASGSACKFQRNAGQVRLTLGPSVRFDPVLFLGTLCISMDHDTAKSQLVNTPSRSMSVTLLNRGDQVCRFDSRGGETTRLGASGLTVLPQGEILVCDIGLSTIQIFTPRGTPLRDLAILPDEFPSCAIVLPDLDTIAVACQDGIRMFNSKTGIRFHDKMLNCMLPYATGLTVNRQGNLLIAVGMGTGQNGCVCVYDPVKHQINQTVDVLTSRDGEQILWSPWYITTTVLDDEEAWVVSDSHDDIVWVVREDGRVVRILGERGCAAGQFSRPAGVCVDKLGNVLVADSDNHRVCVWGSMGSWLGAVDGWGVADDPIRSPVHVAIDASGQLLVLQADGTVITLTYLKTF